MVVALDSGEITGETIGGSQGVIGLLQVVGGHVQDDQAGLLRGKLVGLLNRETGEAAVVKEARTLPIKFSLVIFH